MNGHFPVTIDQFRAIVDQYKATYDNIEIEAIAVTNCLVEEQICNVDGTYNVKTSIGNDALQLTGNWKVNFEKDEEIGYWYIFEVQISGIIF